MADDLKYLDHLVGEVLERLEEAAGVSDKSPMIDRKQTKMRMGSAIIELWHIREDIYRHRPDLQFPAYRAAKESSKERYERLTSLHEEAFNAEASGQSDRAKQLFEELRQYAGSGFYQMVAEAGLYRLTVRKPE